jgi:predicted NBD/HSP70 family sugar kinase
LLGVPVRITNDANCFALAEFHLGVARDFPNVKNMFGVIMGTGVGGRNNLQWKNHQWTAWHGRRVGDTCFSMHPADPVIAGRHGCVETIISGTALQKFFHSMTGKNLKLEEIFNDMHQPGAYQTHHRLIQFFGLALGQIITFLDPDLIVLGGGLSNLDFLYTDGR